MKKQTLFTMQRIDPRVFRNKRLSRHYITINQVNLYFSAGLTDALKHETGTHLDFYFDGNVLKFKFGSEGFELNRGGRSLVVYNIGLAEFVSAKLAGKYNRTFRLNVSDTKDEEGYYYTVSIPIYKY